MGVEGEPVLFEGVVRGRGLGCGGRLLQRCIHVLFANTPLREWFIRIEVCV